MAYNPVSGFTLQVIKQNGQVGSDYYLKFYIANTTTPLSMATDATGGTLLTEAKLNDNGMPISNPLDNSTVFIPHVNQAYRLVVYTSKADADADNTASAFINIPDVKTLVGAELIDELGTAAYVDTGAGATNVPTNADLGTAATKDTGTASGEVPLNSDGSGLAQLNASNLSSGTVPDARISETLSEAQAYRQGNILGTVSQTGGVPTGAVIERGSNANGEYVKFADGTMICMVKRTFSCTMVSAASLYRDANQTLTYPAAFIITPDSYGFHSASQNNWVGQIRGPSTTGTGLAIWDVVSGSPTIVVYGYIAGRWF